MASQRQVIVIGGGAAGFFGAITCAEADPGLRVVLLEATAHPLAKVRISGGGRCNVAPACFDPRELSEHYPRGGRELLGAFHRWQPRDMVAWLSERGVTLKTEADGRMFPATDDSATIVDCLRSAAARAGVQVRTRSGARSVRVMPGAGGRRFEVLLADGSRLGGDAVLLATGGGRSSAGLQIARSLGHAIEPPAPSLFTFHIEDARLAGLAGLSVPDTAISVPGTRLVARGPLLVTHAGLSGPVILRLSAWGARELAAGNYRFGLVVNLVPAHGREALAEALAMLRREHPRRHLGTWNPFSLPLRLWERLVAAAGLEPGAPWAGMANDDLRRLARQLAAAEFAVAGKSLNKEEFVTCGGVRLREVDFRTMESRRCPGLYLAGEVLDIDGLTGGFNFQSAWTTAWIAGRAIAEAPTESNASH